jgi:hypothetical protein
MRHEETQIILGEHEKLSFLLCYLALVDLDLAFWLSSSISMKLMVLLSLWIICYILPLKDTSGCPWLKATLKSPVGARDLGPL